MKKILALTLAILMIACTFSSCGMGDDLLEDIKGAWGGNANNNAQDDEDRANVADWGVIIDGNGNIISGENGNVIIGENGDVKIEINKEDILQGNVVIDKDGNISVNGECSHKDNNNDHKCDECKKTLSKCADEDKNHNCDICDTRMTAHIDYPKDNNHLCDYCGREASNCTDTNKDHKCDECNKPLSACGDNDNDHKCDYCGAALTQCVDKNKDHECDVCEKSTLYIRTDDKITFGSYPQTEVTDTALVATLNSMTGTLPTSENSQEWTSYGYYIEGEVTNFMWYKDVIVGTEKYRGVYFTSYRPDHTTNSSSAYSYQDDNGYTMGIVYWFKHEPINWTVLKEDTANGTALILCDMIIDSQAYQNEYESNNNDREVYNTSNGVPNGTYANNYAQSTIRKWLNDTFYNTAFNELQKQIILITTVDNSVATTDSSTNQYACENTEDKIFLLSYRDVSNSDYGFSSSNSTYATARQKKNTDYAKAQGAWTSTSIGYAGNGSWWLRSPYSGYSSAARPVYYYGSAYDEFGRDVSYTYFGVVPALQIRL